MLLTQAAADRHPDLAVVDAWSITDREAAELTEAVTPQGVVAVCRAVDVRLADAVPPGCRLVVGAVEIRDPGNAGTLVRCADAFGADAVVLTAGSVDPYNPKAVRASVGSIFHLPLATGATLGDLVAYARRAGLQVLATDGAGDARLDRLAAGGELGRPTLWLFGSEARGLPDQVLEIADRVVAVPIFGAAESLNLSTAAAVCLYASATSLR